LWRDNRVGNNGNKVGNYWRAAFTSSYQYCDRANQARRLLITGLSDQKEEFKVIILYREESLNPYDLGVFLDQSYQLY
jgi:hypothetical protein